MTEGATNPPQLSYAPRSRRRGRVWAKRSVGITALLAIVATGWFLGPHAYRLARIWYWERQCMNFAAAPSEILYESLPAGMPKPPIGPPYLDGDDPQVAAVRIPGTFSLQSDPQTIVSRDPICWIRFLQYSGNRTCNIAPSTLVFCHRLTSPSGHLRLVTIERDSFEDNGMTLDRSLAPAVYAFAGWKGCQNLIPGRSSNDIERYIDGPVRFFAGQPDQADASHFTIEYQWADGFRGFLDGYLRDDDTVDLKVRPGPGDVASEEPRFHPSPVKD